MELDGSGFDIPEIPPLPISSQGVQNPNILPSIPLPLALQSHNNMRPRLPLPLPIARESDGSSKNKVVAAEITKMPIARSVDYGKKMRRILASREYSRRHREKQQQYVNDLEAKAESLQAEILEISGSKINESENKNALLRAENFAIKQKIFLMTSEIAFKEAQAEELMKERDRLAKLFEEHHKQLSEIASGFFA